MLGKSKKSKRDLLKINTILYKLEKVKTKESRG